jgi:hypothetical protein
MGQKHLSVTLRRFEEGESGCLAGILVTKHKGEDV